MENVEKPWTDRRERQFFILSVPCFAIFAPRIRISKFSFLIFSIRQHHNFVHAHITLNRNVIWNWNFRIFFFVSLFSDTYYNFTSIFPTLRVCAPQYTRIYGISHRGQPTCSREHVKNLASPYGTRVLAVFLFARRMPSQLRYVGIEYFNIYVFRVLDFAFELRQTVVYVLTVCEKRGCVWTGGWKEASTFPGKQPRRKEFARISR